MSISVDDNVVWQKFYVWKKYNRKTLYLRGSVSGSSILSNKALSGMFRLNGDGTIKSNPKHLDNSEINLYDLFYSRSHEAIYYLKKYSRYDYENDLHYYDMIIYKLRKEEIKGSELETVKSSNINEYPRNGIQSGYWYELVE